MITVIDFLGHILRGGCALAAWVFVLRYSRVEWTKTEHGQNVMGITILVGIFFSLAFTTRLFGRPPWLDVVATVLFAAMFALLVQRNILLTRAQREYAAAGEEG